MRLEICIFKLIVWKPAFQSQHTIITTHLSIFLCPIQQLVQSSITILIHLVAKFIVN